MSRLTVDQRNDNLAIDMCMACIAFERKKNRPIKAIRLRSDFWDMFKFGISKIEGKDFTYDQFFIGNGDEAVEIRKEIIFSGDRLSIEYFKDEPELTI